MKRYFVSAVAITSTVLFTPLAMAHTGHMSHDSSFFAGLLHPLMGIDHLLAMLALGIWSALQKDRTATPLLLTFLVSLVIGFIMGLAGVNFPAIETGIATSVLVLGLLVSCSTQLSFRFALPLVSVFAIFHGVAHGAESGGAHPTIFALGFLLTVTLLTVAGKHTALLTLKKLPVLTKVMGVFLAMMGLSLLAV